MDKVVYDRLDDVLSAIEYNGGGISELLGKGVVKSVQRGLANVTKSGINVTTSDLKISIPISAVNPSKCLLFHDIGLSWGIETGSSGDPILSNIVASVTQNSIDINFRMTISGNGTCRITAYGEWQVIEFY